MTRDARRHDRCALIRSVVGPWLALWLAGCDSSSEPAAADAARTDASFDAAPADASFDALEPGLRPASDLAPNCFDSPAQPFSPENSTPDSFSLLAQGAPGIDFTLADLDGEEWTLSEALLDSPVLLITGSYTCPIYRDRAMPGIEALAQAYQGQVQLVHVYTVEAHPQYPEPSGYRGQPWPMDYSDVSDPKTYAERLDNAHALVAAMPEVVADGQILLIDDLTPRPRNNPFWCSWATCANCGFLVDQQGYLVLVQDWFEAEAMQSAIDSLLGAAG